MTQSLHQTDQAMKRDPSISLIRAFATSAIVLCHIMQYYGMELAWWFNVGVEIFLVMSGFLYGQKEISDPLGFIWKNTKKVLLPCVLWVGIVIIAYLFLAGDAVSEITMLLSLVNGNSFSGINHLWYIPYILFCYLLTPYLYLYSKKLDHSASGWKTILFWLPVFLICMIGSYWNFDFNRILCYLIGYALGVYSLKGKHVLLRPTIWISIAASLMNAVRIYFKYIGSDATLGFFQPLFPAYVSYSHAALGISLFLLMYIALSPVRFKRTAFLQFTDRYSYEIYLTHHIFILSPITALSLASNPWLNIAIALALTLVSAMLLRFISQKLHKKMPL